MFHKNEQSRKKALLNKAKYPLRFVQNTAVGKQNYKTGKYIDFGAKADNWRKS